MIIFNKILKYNIHNNIYIEDNQRESNNYIIKQIKNIRDKYYYYKYIKKLKNYILIKIFLKSQKMYFALNRFVFNYKYKKSKIYNTYDLNLELISDTTHVFKLYKDKFIYQFTYIDFINIIKYSIFNYREINIDNEDFEIIIESSNIKNPYTNIELSIIDLYNFYNFLLKNNINIPLIIKMLHNYNYNYKNFTLYNQVYIIDETFKIYSKNLEKTVKIKYFKNILIYVTEYIINNINHEEIIESCYKNILNDNMLAISINNFIDKNSDLNILDVYIYYYNLNHYFLNTNNYKGFIHYKLILIYKLLLDSNIDFDSNFLKLNNILPTIVYIQIYLNINIENFFINNNSSNIITRNNINDTNDLNNTNYLNNTNILSTNIMNENNNNLNIIMRYYNYILLKYRYFIKSISNIYINNFIIINRYIKKFIYIKNATGNILIFIYLIKFFI